MKKKIFVKAPVLSQSGYGEQSRFALRSLRSREDLFDIYIQPIPWGQTGWIWEKTEFRSWMDERIAQTQFLVQQKQLQPDISLQITIPNEFQKIAPINIAYTAGIETNQCSPQWLPKCNEMDKVLVVSNHSKTSIVETVATAKNTQTGEEFPYRCETPVEVVWENTPRHEPEEIEGLDLEFDNNFLLVSQLGPRKNFENSICWFIEEFIDREVGLVIKTNFKGNCIIDYTQVEKHLSSLLGRYKDRKCKVYLLHGDLTPGQMTGLYCNPKIKALINISHGEGFGLPMFEAAREALPIVTVGWSGQIDFLHHNGKDYFQSVDYTIRPVQKQAVWKGVIEPEQMWAFADQGSYKMTLRKTLKNLDKAKETAKELQTLVLDKFSDEKLFELFCDSILGKIKLKPEPITGISFCIPTNGKRKEKTLLTLKSIKKEMDSFPHEIVICGDIDNFEELEGVKLINEKTAAKTAKVGLLRNKAAKQTKFNTLVWCDDDIILGKNWLEKTLEFSKKEGWFVLGNKILNPDGTRHWDRALLKPHKLVDYETPLFANFIQTAGFFLMRKSIHNQVKWNDESIAFSDKKGGIPEDVDLSLRLNKLNIPISFNKDSTVWHNDLNYTQIENLTLNLQDAKRQLGTEIEPYSSEEFDSYKNEVAEVK